MPTTVPSLTVGAARLDEAAWRGWSGIYAACFTPLTADEGLDEAGFIRHVESLLGQPIRGLYVAGSTGEGFAIDDEVRAATFRIAADRVRRRPEMRIIAHVGSLHTRRAIALAREAERCGCHAVAAVPPAGWKYSYDEITGFYRDIAGATALPLIVYHIPQLTGYDFTYRQLAAWLEMPNVVGLKYSSGDLYTMERLLSRYPRKLIFHGMDELLMHGIALGAVGAIGSTYNLVAPLAERIMAAAQRSDPTARTLQASLNAFIETILASGGVRAMKAVAAWREGWAHPGSPRPANAISDTQRQAVEDAMVAALAAYPERERGQTPSSSVSCRALEM
jgi:N-acetylneuraminate lyase